MMEFLRTTLSPKPLNWRRCCVSRTFLTMRLRMWFHSFGKSRSIVVFLMLAALFALAPGAHASISIVQTKSFANESSGNPLSVTSVGAGHSILVVFGINTNTPGTLSCGWNTGNSGTFTVLTGGTDSSGGNGSGACYICSTASGGTAFNVAGTSGGTYSVTFYELNGTNTSSCFDTSANKTNGSSTSSPSGPSLTLSNSGDFIGSAITTSASGSITVAGGFTLDQSDTSVQSGQAHDLTTTSGTFTPAWTTGNGTWCGITAALVASGGGGPTCTPTLGLMGVGRCG
jgi:hypothetical protein